MILDEGLETEYRLDVDNFSEQFVTKRLTVTKEMPLNAIETITLPTTTSIHTIKLTDQGVKLPIQNKYYTINSINTYYRMVDSIFSYSFDFIEY